MNSYNLSYVLVTRNKLPFLKNAIEQLISNVNDDEEIVVVDGGSTDGSAEYLKKLFIDGIINQFVSESDKGEAHAFNKGFLMAKGELIKLISDDDVFNYSGIRECKTFMLNNSRFDVISTEGGGTSLVDHSLIGYTNYYQDFENWKLTSKVFSFCGLGLMLRKSSFPLLGLFNTSVVSVDAEFTYRITSLKLNLAWYTGFCWIRIYNRKSNSSTMSDIINSDLRKLETVYKNKRYLPNLNRIKYFIVKAKRNIMKGTEIATENYSYEHLNAIFYDLSKNLKKYNSNKPNNFLVRD